MRRSALSFALAGLCLGISSTATAAATAQPADDGGAMDPGDAGGPPPLPEEGTGAIPGESGDAEAAAPETDDSGGEEESERVVPVEEAEGPSSDTVDPFAASGSAELSTEGASGSVDSSVDVGGDAEKDGDPAYINGRREPAVNSLRGGLGLYNTTLADVGGQHTVRFRLHTDFFQKSAFIYDSAEFGSDRNTRFRGSVNLGYSPLKFGEIYFSINSASNRNERDQPDRQDPATHLALGDMEFGLKGAHRFVKGGAVGLGGQLGLGIIQGAGGISNTAVNFNFDVLFTLDIRYLTASNFPFRFTTNIGWQLDNSINVQDWERLPDLTSREVARFALGVNHSRVRMRYAVDFPFRLGKEKQFGLDPIVELAWDVSTQEEFEIFGQPGATPSPLPRSNTWGTLGLRANLYRGLHVDAAVDIGMVSPNFEFGPPTPPWQMILGLGWSFDPKPIIKEVEVAVEPTAPEVTLEGRIVGQVVDENGAPIPDARVTFPGLTTTTILTDASGGFTSFRFPAGTVTVNAVSPSGVSGESSVEVVDAEDAALTLTIEGGLVEPEGGFKRNFVDDQGQPVPGVSLLIVGGDVNQSFSDQEGQGMFYLLLKPGEYEGTASADGFEDLSISFTVVADDDGAPLDLVMKRATPVETPNVKGSKSRIRLKRRIRYKGEALSDKSDAILDELATFLKGHPEYAKVEIGVHTDDRGNPSKRSSARADAVRDYLIGKGVSSDRLVAKGYGDRNPVAVNMTSSGRAKNNRTALKVLKYTGE